MSNYLATALLLPFLALAWPTPAEAHGGRTNSEGCHNDRKRGGYHCHNGGGMRATPKKRAAARPKAKPQRAFAGVYYANCDAARAAGVAPLYRGDPGYRPQMDGDNDGVACENNGVRGSSRNASRSGGAGKATGRVVVPVPVPAPIPSSQASENIPWQPVGVFNASAALPSAWAKDRRAIEGFAVVTDGDSLTINGERIRLFGVDAFEAEQLCGSGMRCGSKATAHLANLVGYRAIKCIQRDTDSYGRIVAVCYYEGQDINAAMVRAGWAVAYRDYSQDYVPDEDFAKRNKIGAHAVAFDTPHDFRRGTGSATAVAQRNTPQAGACIIKGNISGKGEKIYHLPGQSGYQKVHPEAMFCTIEEAEKAGFRARKR